MNTIVAIMDHPGFAANTDVLVLVDPDRQRLLWLPRDLWCPRLTNRINAAYRIGGPERLKLALAEHGLAAEHWLCLSRDATEAALADARVVVPVPVRMTFHYPLSPQARLEDGRKIIEFNPPAEVLQGERIHQWIGARHGSDLHRIERQKVFLRRLLDQRFEFGRCLSTPAWYQCSGPLALADLSAVRSSWRFDTLSGLQPEMIDDKDVLVRSPIGQKPHS